MPFGVKRDVIEGLGVEELVVIPFDGSSPSAAPRTSSSTCCWRSSTPSGSRSARTSASAPKPKATRRCWKPAPSSRPGWCRWSRSTARPSPRPGSGRWSPPARWSGARRCLGAPFMVEGDGRQGRPARARARLPDRQHRPRRPPRDPRPRRLRGLRRRRSRRGQRRRPADLRERQGSPDRDLPDRPRGGSLRQDPARRLRRAPARRAPLPERRGAGRADAPRRRGRQAGLRGFHLALASLVALLVFPVVALAAEPKPTPPVVGQVSEYELGAGTRPTTLVAGPDGNLWFAGIRSVSGGFADVLGKVTPQGQVSEFELGTHSANVGLSDIAAGPDGNLWFTERRQHQDRADHDRRHDHRVRAAGTAGSARRRSPPGPTATSGSPSGGGPDRPHHAERRGDRIPARGSAGILGRRHRRRA